jgi:hypothetical protein
LIDKIKQIPVAAVIQIGIQMQELITFLNSSAKINKKLTIGTNELHRQQLGEIRQIYNSFPRKERFSPC